MQQTAAPSRTLTLQSGCGATCLKAGDYAQRLRELPCEDVPKDNALFRVYLDDVLNVQKSFPNDWRAVSLIAQALQLAASTSHAQASW